MWIKHHAHSGVGVVFPVEEEDRAVIFNEAVELSKEFGGRDSYRFVNGVLTAAAEEKNETVSGD